MSNLGREAESQNRLAISRGSFLLTHKQNQTTRHLSTLLPYPGQGWDPLPPNPWEPSSSLSLLHRPQYLGFFPLGTAKPVTAER